jgi:hypothetical protein
MQQDTGFDAAKASFSTHAADRPAAWNLEAGWAKASGSRKTFDGAEIVGSLPDDLLEPLGTRILDLSPQEHDAMKVILRFKTTTAGAESRERDVAVRVALIKAFAAGTAIELLADMKTRLLPAKGGRAARPATAAATADFQLARIEEPGTA